MGRKTSSPVVPSSTTSLLASPAGTRVTIQPAVERLIAVGYGLTYDAIVRGFAPYEALIEEVGSFVARGARPGPPVGTRVLDVSCGVGSVASRLARRGWTVAGVDAVAHLVEVARRRHGGTRLSLTFHHADVAREPLPTGGAFDVLVSMHTLYWHPDPAALLAACRRALKPGGHAVFLTYERQARVGRTFAEVRRQHGWWAAVRALRWLLPTAIFDLFRGIEPRYLTREEFDAALHAAGFEILERRTTFLEGISLLAWARTAPPASSARP